MMSIQYFQLRLCVTRFLHKLARHIASDAHFVIFTADIFLGLKMFTVNQSLVNFRDFNSESTDKAIFLLAL